MTSHPVLLLVLACITFLFMLMALRSKRSGFSVLYRTCELFSLILIGLASAIMASCIGFEIACGVFWKKSKIEYWTRWNYLTALPVDKHSARLRPACLTRRWRC